MVFRIYEQAYAASRIGNFNEFFHRSYQQYLPDPLPLMLLGHCQSPQAHACYVAR